MKALFPIIDAEFGRRLFDADLVDHIRYENDNQLKEVVKELIETRRQLAEVSAPGFRFPNPAVDISARIGWLNLEIARLEAKRADMHANPRKKWAAFTFREKVEFQLGYVAPMPNFRASREEIADDNARYSRYVDRVTAEAEIIELWNSL